jgi:hypothetical protein
MVFAGIENQTVELRIVNYQYPDLNDGSWDRNWLNIYLDVNSKAGHWHTLHPSLTTWEVNSLINWFESLSQGIQPENQKLDFTEPNLSLQLLNAFDSPEKRIRIKFELESRPPKARALVEYFVDLVADSYELKRLSTDLKTELDKFPERSAHGVLTEVGRKWWQKIF